MRISLDRRGVVAGLSASMITPTRAAGSSEVTTLFDTVAHLDAAQRSWVVPLHAWVYRPQHSQVRKALIASLLKQRYGLEVTPASEALFDRRINLLLADNVSRRRPSITIAGTAHELPPTGANGHTTADVRVPVSPAAPLQGSTTPVLIRGAMVGTEAPAARVHFVAPEGVSIISDIDDTVKISNVLDKTALFRATFLEPFKSVPGMSDLFNRVAGDNVPVHYVSSSPWHLYAPLREWLAADGFPVSALHLKQIRLKDRTVLDILKSPAETKPPVIADILLRFPRRRFILVGDSGEKDPEVYAGIARRFPQQVNRVLIRRAPGDQSGRERFDRTFAGLPRELWQVFDDPSQVK